MVVDLGGSADHAAVQEDVERCRLQILFRECSRPVVLPEDCQQQCCDNRIHVDAETVARSSTVVERLNELTIESMENVVLATLFHELGDKPLSRIVVDWLALKKLYANKAPDKSTGWF